MISVTNPQWLRVVVIICVLALAFSVGARAQKPHSAPYTWKSVQMVGGGFVDGIVFHPTQKGLRYARTDIGGAYRWDDKAKVWVPIMDWVGYKDVNLMGVESIAVDPSDPNWVYLACGTYSNPNAPNAAILRSHDRGKTFQRTDMPFKMGGNENGRGNGERMAVDPNNGAILYFGSRQAGLWRSADHGATWSEVKSFPNPTQPPPANAAPGGFGGRNPSVGIIAVVFDPLSGSRGKGSSTIYAAVSVSGQNNLFKSADAGVTWQPVADQPTQYRPTHMILASNGTLYLSYGSDPGPNRMRDGGVWKLDTGSGAWTDITPDKPDPNNQRAFGYAAVAVEAQHPQTLIASSFYRPGGEEIFRSTDGGKIWKPIFHNGDSSGVYDFAIAPYVARTPIHWLFDIEIDPADPNHALFTTGYGGYETFNLTDADVGKPTKWSVMTRGIEETVALDLLSPPQGAHLITAIGDYGGFVHWDLDRPAAEGNFDNPHFGNTTGVACGESAPNVIVRVGRASGNRGGGNIGYSLDSGKTWQPTASTPQPNSNSGHIAVSADGATWIWSLGRAGSYYTRDRGATWTPCAGLPNNIRVIADRVNPQQFYGLALFAGKLYVSMDGGANFAEQNLNLPGGLPQPGGNRGDGRGGQDQIYATPGKQGDLWVAAFEGLYHATALGSNFVKLEGVQEIHAFGFGKAAPGADYPALYLIGVVQGVRGIFRSDDTGRSWVRINDDQHQWGLLLQITGDPRIFGRVYVGTHGRGTVYGDPVRREH
ncbi:MAG TPA: xyloglucanase [Chthonomonadaceae bacterium]|nr:xyloglucanase [Chthonomonadaceae bacterium]